MRRRWVYRKDEATGEVHAIEVTAQAEEWINTGCRYGSETLSEMKKNGLVPPTDFTEHWAKKQAEKDRLYKLGQGDLSQLRRNDKVRQQLVEAMKSAPYRKPYGGRDG